MNADRLKGGKADGITSEKIIKLINSLGLDGKEQLELGIEVELEHTTDPLIAEEIARDHLAEFPDYYTELELMEKKLKSKWKDRWKNIIDEEINFC